MKKTKKNKVNYEIIVLGMIVLFAVIVSLFRCQQIVFGSDECFSVRLARESMPDLLRLTAEDVHPPLFYIWLKIVYRIVGRNAFAFHLSAAIPYIAVLILGITVIYKNFGYRVSAAFTLLIAVMEPVYENANVVRMYILALPFFTVLFLAGYELIKKQKKIYWIIFTICGIGAAYCHYYAFAMSMIIYFGVFVILICQNRQNIWKCVICSVVSLLGYAPWLWVFLNTVSRVNEEYWISRIPSVYECIQYLFGMSKWGNVIAILFAISVTYWTYQEIKAIRCGAQKMLSNEYFMAIIAVATIVIMAAFASIYSILVKPIFLVRYLFPAVGPLYLVFALALEKIWTRWNKGILGFYVFLLLIVCICIPANVRNYYNQKNLSEETKNVLIYMQDNLHPEEMLISERCELTAEVFRYYLEDNKHNVLEERGWDEMDLHGTSYYFNKTEMTEDTREQIVTNGYEIVDNGISVQGHLGDVPVYVYKLYRE